MGKIVLSLVKSNKYLSIVRSIIKREIAHKTVIYVTTNNISKNIINSLKKNKIPTKKIIFIDCISKKVGKVTNEDNCLFINGPQNLTAIAIAINKCLKKVKGDKVVIFDSISTLLVYTDSATTARFYNFLINKIRYRGDNGIMLVLEDDYKKNVIKHIAASSDETKRW